jgi:hypothetical protein
MPACGLIIMPNFVFSMFFCRRIASSVYVLLMEDTLEKDCKMVHYRIFGKAE